ncbi:MAG: M48 family metallopeptidase [Treponema sp.]|nr:M48 family metallopeptidase [Treponema sp.]
MFIALLFIFVSSVPAAGFASKFSSLKERLDAAGKRTESKIDLKTDTIRTAGKSFSKAFEEISPENEYYIGRSVAATILTNYKTYKNEKLEQYLNSICQALVINSDVPEIYNGYHVKVLDSEEINAFATSGGHIFITRGLISCTTNEDSLAAVIAHELGHIQLKHGLKAIKNDRFMTATKQTVNAVTKSPSKIQAEVMDGMVNDVMTQMVNNGYSQKQEYEADAFAVHLMEVSGYAPSEMITMLELIEKNQKNSKIGLAKTHPSPKSRITNVKANMGKNAYSIKVSDVRTSRYNKIMSTYAS